MARRTTTSKYQEAVAALRATVEGEERNMYPYIRQIFTDALGYATSAIKVDTRLESGGIPDLAVYVDGPTVGSKSKKLLWIVLEAKDESDAFLDPSKREAVFKEKSKYIDLDTAFFVMVDPACLVIRQIISRSSEHDPQADTVLEWKDLADEDVFKSKTNAISLAMAGTNPRLEAFRRGEVEYISSISLEIVVARESAWVASAGRGTYPPLPTDENGLDMEM